jgi:hypothetical protein
MNQTLPTGRVSKDSIETKLISSDWILVQGCSYSKLEVITSERGSQNLALFSWESLQPAVLIRQLDRGKHTGARLERYLPSGSVLRGCGSDMPSTPLRLNALLRIYTLAAGHHTRAIRHGSCCIIIVVMDKVIDPNQNVKCAE